MSVPAGRLRGVRAMVARRMRQSLAETAQLTFTAEADMRALMARRASDKQAGGSAGMEDYLIAALARTARAFPSFTLVWADGALTENDGVHVAVAMATDQGLMTPVIRHADALSVDEISTTRRALSDKAAAGSLAAGDMVGGAITISNLGLSRVQHFTPILNYPQIAIVGIGTTTPRLRLEQGAPIEVPMMGLSLTVDHAVIDGAPAGAFLTALCEAIEAA